MESLIKSNFPVKPIEKEDTTLTPTEEYEKKAKESIGGSMVFTERKKRTYDPLSETDK